MHGSCGTAGLGLMCRCWESPAATPRMHPIHPRLAKRDELHAASCISHCPPVSTLRTVEAPSSGMVGHVRSECSFPPSTWAGSRVAPPVSRMSANARRRFSRPCGTSTQRLAGFPPWGSSEESRSTARYLVRAARAASIRMMREALFASAPSRTEFSSARNIP
eukprot:10734897-Heterocapsa_arctica.AAC.1